MAHPLGTVHSVAPRTVPPSTTQGNVEWEPALGTYGWVWVMLGLIVMVGGFKYRRYRRDREESRRRFEEFWKRRPDESDEQFHRRVVEEKNERRRRRAAQNRSSPGYRTSGRSSTNHRREFDPPGGWGATGPDMG